PCEECVKWIVFAGTGAGSVTASERAVLGLRLREVEERGDLLSLRSEFDRKVDQSLDLERRSGKVNSSVSAIEDVVVLAAATVRQDDPLVLVLRQIVLDELVNQLVGEMLQDVLGYEQVRGGEVLGNVADLKLNLACLVVLADGLDDIGGDVDPEVTRVPPVYCGREAPVPGTRVDDRLDSVFLDERFYVRAILPRDLQGRTRTARSVPRAVLPPSSLKINAIESAG